MAGVPRLPDATYDPVEPSYYEAEAYSRMNHWPEVLRLLQQTNSAFQIAAASNATSQFAARGSLLLGEALLREQRPDEGEKLLLELDPAGWTGDLKWQRQFLLCRLRLAAGRAETAFGAISNLTMLSLDNPRHQTASFFLQGQILEKLGRTNEALDAYANNLADDQPEQAQRQALARTIPLIVALNPLPQAIQALEALIKLHPQSKAQDMLLVSLGELYLKAFAAPAPLQGASNAPVATGTNFLAGALTNLNSVIANFTNSPLLAKARLDRGWCHWLSLNALDINRDQGVKENGDTRRRLQSALDDFQQAANRLPVSQNQAVALFKQADARFLLQDYPGAAANYNLLLTRYRAFPRVTNELFDLALYQKAEAEIRCGNHEEASKAVDTLLRWFPGSYFGTRGSLLMGEDLNRKYDYPGARREFTRLRNFSSNSPMLPKVEYAIAQTYDFQGDWKEAISRYQSWAATHDADNALMPDVQFHLALVYGKSGLTNDALAAFNNFLVRFPTNSLAPWARNWIAEFYFNQDEPDYVSAEKNYQLLYQKFPGAGDLACQAQLAAGRAALARQDPGKALEHFTTLLKDTNAPALWTRQCYFAYGDASFQLFLTSPNQTNVAYLRDAIAALSKLTNDAPTNAIAVEALGRLGDYYMQWANTNTYATVKQLYETIVHFPDGPAVSIAARSQAEYGLGWVAERLHQPAAALDHYLNVLNSYPSRFDPYWIEAAGKAAARVCEEQQHWQEAVRVYEQVVKALPALRSVVEKKKAEDERRAAAN